MRKRRDDKTDAKPYDEWLSGITRDVMYLVASYRNVSKIGVSQDNASIDPSKMVNKLSDIQAQLLEGLVTYGRNPDEVGPIKQMAKAQSFAAELNDTLFDVDGDNDANASLHRFERVSSWWTQYQDLLANEHTSGEYANDVKNWTVYSYYMNTGDFGKKAGDITARSENIFRKKQSMTKTIINSVTGDDWKPRHELGDSSSDHYDNTIVGAGGLPINPQLATIRVYYTLDDKGEKIVDGVKVHDSVSPSFGDRLTEYVERNHTVVLGRHPGRYDLSQIVSESELNRCISETKGRDETFDSVWSMYEDASNHTTKDSIGRIEHYLKTTKESDDDVLTNYLNNLYRDVAEKGVDVEDDLTYTDGMEEQDQEQEHTHQEQTFIQRVRALAKATKKDKQEMSEEVAPEKESNELEL